MPAIAVPLSPDKLGAWEEWVGQLNGARKEAFDEMNARYGVTDHRAYLQGTPDGGFLVLAVHEGPGADSFLPSVIASDHEFDRWFVGMISDLHGIDPSQPMPPPAERRL